MASSSGNSSGGSTQLQAPLMVDQRKRKRMQSNRQSARRSRVRKQQHVDDLTAQVAQLKEENTHVVTTMSIANQLCLNVEAENSVLRAQVDELSHRLQSLNDILSCLNTNSGVFGGGGGGFHGVHEGYMENSWNSMYLNQPIMASADIFQY